MPRAIRELIKASPGLADSRLDRVNGVLDSMKPAASDTQKVRQMFETRLVSLL
jgi:hypothetical protein